MHQPIGLLGAGGQADEIAGYLLPREVAFRAVSAGYLTDATIDIASPTDAQRATEVIAAVGAPAVRRLLVESWAGARYPTLVAEGVFRGPRVDLGEGTVIAPGAVLTTDVAVGRHCLINVGATVSHGVTMGDFVTIGPGAHLGGDVRLGPGVVVGIGATVLPGVSVASGVLVGAGAVVVRDVAVENAVLVGNPAKVLRTADGWPASVS
jgi:sugar O-acyltransferase (sialic acid O-acetyltransferase NeuD family)